MWQAQHEWGAQQVFEMLSDLQGFYMKVSCQPQQTAMLTTAAGSRDWLTCMALLNLMMMVMMCVAARADSCCKDGHAAPSVHVCPVRPV